MENDLIGSGLWSVINYVMLFFEESTQSGIQFVTIKLYN